MMLEFLVAGLALTGGGFMLVAGIGILRLPDLFTRMQAAAKGLTLGIGCLMLAVALHFRELDTSGRAVLVMVFVALTAPVGVHMVARAAFVVGVPLWEGTVRNELQDANDTAAATARQSEEPPAGTAPRTDEPEA